MYLEHFGLSESPFRITPHTDFFFSGANRGATLDALLYAILHDEGIVKVSGEVGSGKTMLCRVLMERLPPHVVIIYLANPSLSRDDILYAIADELDMEVAENARVSAVMRTLQDRLIALYAEGRQVVVLIDEAHAMPAETLEEIRLLSNLESNRHKLLQLVLFGQPELNDVLGRSDMRQLKERITHNFALEPLVRDDIAQYLDFRMRAAGYRGPEIFNPAAIRLLSNASLGLTRRINILADKALLATFAESAHQVMPKQVRAAIRDSEFGKPAAAWQRRLAYGVGLAALAAAIAGATAWWPAIGNSPAPPVAPVAAPPPGQPAPASAPSPASAAALPASTAAPAAPVAAAVPAPEPVTGQAASTAAEEDTRNLPPVTRRLVQDTRQWLAGVADDQWFIQLTATNAQRADFIETFIGKAEKLVEAKQLRAYSALRNGEPRIGVIYGQFADQRAAEEAIRGLPSELRLYKPYPRQVRRLR